MLIFLLLFYHPNCKTETGEKMRRGNDGRDGRVEPAAMASRLKIRAWRAIERKLDAKMPDLEADSRDPAIWRRAIRQERQLGRGGHWAYDLNRHIALLQKLRAADTRNRK
jgi:hypothetical protein